MSALASVSPLLVLLGHNMGLGDEDVTIRTRDGGNLRDLSLQDSLRRIDEFDELAQARIIGALPYQFELAGGAP
jgi:hypothetical protein